MFIFVSGVSGAGKTTLIGAALKQIPNLVYLTTVTTRPQRPGEENSFEYRFVDDVEYERLRLRSKNWDHTDYNGFKYGADVEEVLRLQEQGRVIICSVAPDIEVIDEMKRLYGVTPVTIWIDTPKYLAAERVADDLVRSGRAEGDVLKGSFENVFEPQGELVQDKHDFVDLVRRAITQVSK